MEQTHFTQQVQLLSQVAVEAVDEPDVISRHPEIIEALTELAGYDRLNDHFGGNGHDPNGFVAALAEGLAPYKVIPLDDNPELVQRLAFLAWVLQGDRTPAELAEMQMLA